MLISEDHAPAPTLRVVLVDARQERRGLMRNLVDGSESGASVVAEAGDRDAALLMVDEQRADVVLLDVQMPIADGLGTIRDLRGSFPRLGIVVCSFDLDRAIVQDARAQGADACLAKPAGRGDVLAALGAACSGKPSSSEALRGMPA
jgi:DNA-binding NarL/FixJ family response regulator